jgi:hypothetical protein
MVQLGHLEAAMWQQQGSNSQDLWCQPTVAGDGAAWTRGSSDRTKDSTMTPVYIAALKQARAGHPRQ